MMTRKKRTDRNHIIYKLIVDGEQYIGVTAKTQSTVLKSVKSRVYKHFYRAHSENKDWLLCQALRTIEHRDDIEFEILAVIRGKAEAHKFERGLIKKLDPYLNSDKR